jgi:hypothetical protein
VPMLMITHYVAFYFLACPQSGTAQSLVSYAIES